MVTSLVSESYGVAIRYMAHDYKGATWSVRNQRKQSEIPSVEMVESRWVGLEFVNDNSLKRRLKGELEPDICALLISMGSSHKSSKRSFPLNKDWISQLCLCSPTHHILTLDYCSPACTTGGSVPSVCILAKNQPKSICVLLKFVTTTVHAECFCVFTEVFWTTSQS